MKRDLYINGKKLEPASWSPDGPDSFKVFGEDPGFEMPERPERYEYMANENTVDSAITVARKDNRTGEIQTQRIPRYELTGPRLLNWMVGKERQQQLRELWRFGIELSQVVEFETVKPQQQQNEIANP